MIIHNCDKRFFNIAGMSFSYEQKLQINRHSKDAGIKLTFHQSEIFALFDELIHKPWGYQIWQPLIDVTEKDDYFQVNVDLPGVKAEEVNVTVSDTRLLIEGTRRFDKDFEDAKIVECERPEGTFYREIEFFEKLSTTDIKKQYDNGVLTIIVRKYENKS